MACNHKYKQIKKLFDKDDNYIDSMHKCIKCNIECLGSFLSEHCGVCFYHNENCICSHNTSNKNTGHLRDITGH